MTKCFCEHDEEYHEVSGTCELCDCECYDPIDVEPDEEID
jgi:hypothetical protein